MGALIVVRDENEPSNRVPLVYGDGFLFVFYFAAPLRSVFHEEKLLIRHPCHEFLVTTQQFMIELFVSRLCFCAVVVDVQIAPAAFPSNHFRRLVQLVVGHPAAVPVLEDGGPVFFHGILC